MLFVHEVVCGHYLCYSYWLPFTVGLVGAFKNLRQVTISFVMSVRLCPRGTTRLPLNGFSWNLMFEGFSKICWKKFKFYYNQTRIKG